MFYNNAVSKRFSIHVLVSSLPNFPLYRAKRNGR
jgi:hypothetical protein